MTAVLQIGNERSFFTAKGIWGILQVCCPLLHVSRYYRAHTRPSVPEFLFFKSYSHQTIVSLEKKKSILEKESLRRGRSLYLVRVAQEFALWASFSVSQPNLRPVFAVKQRRLVTILHRFSQYVRPSVCTLPLPFSVTVYIASMPPLMWSVT